MTFSKLNPRKLYITDNTQAPVCISVIVPLEVVEKEEEDDEN